MSFQSPLSRQGAAAAALVAAVAVVAAGCGSSNKASSGSGSSAPATVAKADAVVKLAESQPQKISVTTPIGKPVPTGKKLVFISCGVRACELQGDIIKQGAKDLGWTSETIGTDGSPQSLQAAFDTAMRKGADGILLNAVDKTTMAKQLAEAQKKGVPFVTSSSTDPVGGGILYNTSTVQQNTRIGDYLAAKVVADSKGKANALYANISAFKILQGVGDAFTASFAKYCPTCSADSIDIPLTSLGKDAPNKIVAYLRSHPKVNYVVLSVSDALGTGLPAALNAAGLGGKVKIVGQGGDETLYQYMANGQLDALVPYDYYSVDYQMLDALARHFAGVPVQQTAPPLWLVTKQNQPSTNQIKPLVPGYRDQFLQLWGKPAA